MKNNIVRLAVLSIAVAGFAASTVSAHARTVTKAAVAPVSIIGSQTLCAPSDPSHCGMD
jgi:hypothetical protein